MTLRRYALRAASSVGLGLGFGCGQEAPTCQEPPACEPQDTAAGDCLDPLVGHWRLVDSPVSPDDDFFWTSHHHGFSGVWIDSVRLDVRPGLGATLRVETVRRGRGWSYDDWRSTEVAVLALSGRRYRIEAEEALGVGLDCAVSADLSRLECTDEWCIAWRWLRQDQPGTPSTR